MRESQIKKIISVINDYADSHCNCVSKNCEILALVRPMQILLEEKEKAKRLKERQRKNWKNNQKKYRFTY